jgi:hypothetical protein
MQHVRVISLTDVEPHLASLWRDDQWIMWLLAPGLRWAPPPGHNAVEFTGGDPWPGTKPSPQTELSDPLEDRRAYVAYCQTPLGTSDPQQSYIYTLWVADKDGNPTMVRFPDPTTGVPIDPEIVNRPLP